MELWDWKEREKVEAIEERFLRWVMGLDGRTPGYMVREEVQRDKLVGRTGNKTWGYEKRLKQGE